MLNKIIANLEAIERILTDEIAERLTTEELKVLIGLSRRAQHASKSDLAAMLNDTEEILKRIQQKLN